MTKFLVSLPLYQRILDKNDENDMESAVRALFSDRELIHNSILQVVWLQQVKRAVYCEVVADPRYLK